MSVQRGVATTGVTRSPLFVSSRPGLFFALSRTPHGILDLATPILGALLALGSFPPLPVAALGLLTAFAGYTAVYALNDLVDCRADRAKIRQGGLSGQLQYLDAVGVRHPLAQGLLSLRQGLLWTAGWSLVALVGAWMLNPACAFIFLAGCALEAVYCRLLGVSHLRVLVSGVVKTLGGIAAAFAVTRHPSLPFLGLFFSWIFAWEIGGQNIPADWVDREEDRESGARTIPVKFGRDGASAIILVSLSAATILGVMLARTGGRSLLSASPLAALSAGAALLLIPAWKLSQARDTSSAIILFNRASLYPAAMLASVLLGMGGCLWKP